MEEKRLKRLKPDYIESPRQVELRLNMEYDGLTYNDLEWLLMILEEQFKEATSHYIERVKEKLRNKTKNAYRIQCTSLVSDKK